MARTSTKAKTEQTETTTSVQASQPVVEQPKAKVPRAKKAPTVLATSTAVVEPVVLTPPPVQAQVSAVEESMPESTEFTELSSMSGDFLLKLNKWVSEGNSLKTEFKALEKRWGRELKNAQKSKKRSKRGGNRSPSGFVKPTKISDELADFLEKPLGSEMARTEVTKEINNYIRANGLQDKDNGRKIIPDNKLSGLLKISKDEELTYFNLQRYMSPHFPKTLKKPVTTAE
jgi:SWIB-domain-containing proteins implicated in chromatin remodeling